MKGPRSSPEAVLPPTCLQDASVLQDSAELAFSRKKVKFPEEQRLTLFSNLRFFKHLSCTRSRKDQFAAEPIFIWLSAGLVCLKHFGKKIKKTTLDAFDAWNVYQDLFFPTMIKVDMKICCREQRRDSDFSVRCKSLKFNTDTAPPPSSPPKSLQWHTPSHWKIFS